MQKKNNLQKVSDILIDLQKNNNNDERILISEIKKCLGQRGFGIMLLIFSLPLIIPIPLPPGFTTIASIPLVIFSTQMVFCMQRPWIPKWLSNKSLKRKTVDYLINKTVFLLKKIEKFSKPRIIFLSTEIAESILGIFCLLCAISIANPLPLTNFMPALSIVSISFGLINQDGLIIIIGIILGILGLAFSLSVTILGPSFIYRLFS